MDIDPPEQTQTQPQQPTQQQQPKKTTPPSSTRELTTCTIKQPPFSYVHLSAVDSELAGGPQGTPAIEIENIDPLQVRSYCTAALQQFLGETGASIVPDILLIQRKQGQDKKRSRNGQAAIDIYLRLAREDLTTFAAAITAFPGLWAKSTAASGNGDKRQRLLLQVQSCGDWLGSLVGKSEEGDIWGS